MEIVLTSENFQKEAVESGLPVLIDFWATWCGPCRMLAPVVEEIADKYEGRIKVGKVNVDEAGELAVMFRVVSIPMLAVIRDGKTVSTSVGYMPAEEIEQMLEKTI